MTIPARRRGGPTLADVARAAGVSLATASRVFSGTATVHAELAARVRDAGERLGYRPDVAAQMTANSRSPLIGVITDQPRSAHFAAISRGIVAGAGEHGLTAMICGAGDTTESYATAARILVGYRPRATILVARTHVLDALADEGTLEPFGAAAGRIVAIGRTTGTAFAAIGLDDLAGASAIGRRMGTRGYLRPLVVGTADDFPAEHARTVRLAEEAARWADAVDLATVAEPTRDAGRAALVERLDDPARRPDIVLTASDELAVGVLAALRERGIVPGDDIAVTGFDDLPMSSEVVPALTTVRTGLAEAGARAVSFALGDEELPPPPTTAEVVLRDSTPR